MVKWVTSHNHIYFLKSRGRTWRREKVDPPAWATCPHRLQPPLSSGPVCVAGAPHRL
jgi:hypothetical protein